MKRDPLTQRLQWPLTLALCAGTYIALLSIRHLEALRTFVIVLGVLAGLQVFNRDTLRRNAPAARALSASWLTVLVIATLVVQWFHDFRQYYWMRAEIFRPEMASMHWPLYGRELPATVVGWFVVPTVAAGSIFALRRLLGQSRTFWNVAAFSAVFVAINAIAFAMSDADRTLGVEPLAPDQMFIRDAAKFDGTLDLLRNYAAMMPKLSWFGAHYPPGHAWLSMQLGTRVELLHFASVLALPGLVFLAARRLTRDGSVATMSALLAATGGLMLVLATLISTSSVAALGAAGLWLGAVAIDRNTTAARRLVAGAGLGLLVAGWSLLSFSVLYWAISAVLLMAGLVVVKRASVKHAAASLAVSLATFAIALLGLKLLGYDTLEVLQIATAEHHRQIGGVKSPPHVMMEEWLLRSIGNVLAFVLGHLPLMCLAFLGLGWPGEHRKIARLIGGSALLVLVAAGFSGTFIIETERIWIFWVPAFCIAGGTVLAQQTRREQLWLISIAFLSGVAMELCYRPYL